MQNVTRVVQSQMNPISVAQQQKHQSTMNTLKFGAIIGIQARRRNSSN